MKYIKLLLSVLLVVISSITAIPAQNLFKKKDPYFFLKPVPPVSFPFPMYEKAAKIDEYFWITPNKKVKSGYSIFLSLTVSKKIDWPAASVHRVFNSSRPVNPVNYEDAFKIKLYKMGQNNESSLIYEENISKLYHSMGWGDDDFMYRFIHLSNIPVPTEYGQYRIAVEMLADWPELKIDNIKYSIVVREYRGGK